MLGATRGWCSASSKALGKGVTPGGGRGAGEWHSQQRDTDTIHCNNL